MRYTVINGCSIFIYVTIVWKLILTITNSVLSIRYLELYGAYSKQETKLKVQIVYFNIWHHSNHIWYATIAMGKKNVSTHFFSHDVQNNVLKLTYLSLDNDDSNERKGASLTSDMKKKKETAFITK